MDKSLPYYDIIMKCPMQDFQVRTLPDGYTYKSYEEGDEEYWCELECAVNEFDHKEDAMAYFNRVFMPFKQALPTRMFFILDDKQNYVATASAWFKDDDTRHYALLHWVSTSPKHQNKGLGKSIVLYALSHFKSLEPNEKSIYLHTQTWSYKAIALYYALGFRITWKPAFNSLSDSKCIEVLKKVLPESIMQDIDKEDTIQ